MADVEIAIQSVLWLEDATLSGVITNRAGDNGGLTRYGLCARWHGDLRVQGFYAAMSNAAALVVAQQAYRRCYAEPLLLAEITSQNVANHLLSFAVNDGLERGVELLQAAVNQLLLNAVKVDGAMGAMTIAAVNRCLDVSLLNALRLKEIAFHVGLDQPQNLLGWMRRDLA